MLQYNRRTATSNRAQGCDGGKDHGTALSSSGQDARLSISLHRFESGWGHIRRRSDYAPPVWGRAGLRPTRQLTGVVESSTNPHSGAQNLLDRLHRQYRLVRHQEPRRTFGMKSGKLALSSIWLGCEILNLTNRVRFPVGLL